MLEPHILKLPTPRLLAYYKKYYRGHNPYGDHWGYVPDESADAYNKWDAEHDAIKAELDLREHVKC
jgi:hypothetical protein